jgi:hypothetical protein
MTLGTTTTDISWEAIVGKIRKQRAILVVGPEAFLSADKSKSLHQSLIGELDIPNNRFIQKYYADDDFFLFNVGGGRSFTCERIYDFYKRHAPGEELIQLARIPFHVILSVSPGKLLNKAFDKLNFQYQFDYYRKTRGPSEIKDPTVQLPLIYNLFGCIDDEESLVLTHNDLYDYFKSIFARRSMPEKLKNALTQREINCFIFLGIPFDKWYMQLLLRELEIHRSSEDFIRYAANQSLTEDVKTFCTEQFTISFVSNNIPNFIHTLYGYCEEADILRTEQDTDRWTQIKNYLAEGKLGIAIEQFVDLTRGTELEDEAIGISGRHRRYERKKNQGILYGNELDVQANQIQSSLLDLIQVAEKQ